MKLLLLFLLAMQIFTVVWGSQKDSLISVIEQYIDENDPPLPVVNHLYVNNINDISLCKGPSKTYYLTGTSGDITGVQKGIRVWASRNLIDWNLIGLNNSYVWTFDDDASDQQKKIATIDGWKQRGIIAPKIHYIKNEFWITYTNSNSNKSGILKSINKRAQGPYVQVLPDSLMVNGANASLFVDKDSTVYFIWNGGYMHTMKDDLSGFKSAYPVLLGDNVGNRIGGKEVFLTLINDRYCLTSGRNISQNMFADVGSRYDGVIAISQNLSGPYRVQDAVIPHGGTGHIFQDFDGFLWYCFSGADVSSPVNFNPAFLHLIEDKGSFLIQHPMSLSGSTSNAVVFVSKEGNNSSGRSWQNAYTSIQKAVDVAPKGAQIWIAGGIYEEAVVISLREGLYLFGGFRGDERSFNERDIEKNKVIISGRNKIRQVFSILSSSYVRVDGLTITNGNATNGISYQYYGAGMYIIGGGNTIRIVNCNFEKNISEQDGGALYVSIGASPTFINCAFKDNIAMHNGGAVALYSNTSNGYNFKFYNCTFENNLAYNEAGAIFFDSNQNGHGLLSLVNCLVIRNESAVDCGVISVDRSSNLFVLNTTFCYNKGASQGAAIANLGKVPGKSRVANSIFYKNEGGSLFNIEGEGEPVMASDKLKYKEVWVNFSNCIFNANEVNCLVERNYDSKIWPDVDQLNKSIMGTDCSSAKPEFVDEAIQNFKLRANSKLLYKTANMPFFKYAIDGTLRSENAFNPGCY